MTRQPRELSAGLHGHATARPGVAYRVLRRTWRVAAACLRLRIRVEGLEHLPPTGPYIVAGAPHRTWIDPFLLWGWLPARPRLLFFGDAATMSRSPVRRAVLRLVGGVIPIPSTHLASAPEAHFAAAAEALQSGGVFCLFPETGPAAPPGSIRRLGSGVGYIALRNAVPIVPIAIGGNHELFLGRTIIVRVQPPLAALDLAGGDAAPPPGSPEERAAVHRLLAGLAGACAEPVAAAHRDAEPPPGTRKRARFLTTLFH
ncbi:MAG TPA: lysophospholipid acyltransferase family protein [Candidatus Limnocylindrales bacterium]|nr:lysophospholipid acyltransferase family protein [Candidatus Limnocylindrales bacterium]